MPISNNSGGRRTYRRSFLAAGSITSLTALAGCIGGNGDDDDVATGDGNGGGSNGDITELSAAIIPTFAHAPVYKPGFTGELEEHGIDATYRPTPGSSQIVTFVTQGEVDIGAAAMGAAALNGLDRGLPITPVAPIHSYPPDPDSLSPTPIVASESSGITDISDFEGERVAVNTTSSASSWMLDLALREGGLTIDDVDLQTMPFPDMVPAMENEAIVGGTLSEPLATIADQRIGVTRLADNVRPEGVMTVLMYNTEWAEQNPDAANDFMVEYMRATREFQDDWDSETSMAVINDLMGDPPEDAVQEATKPYYDPNLEFDIESLSELESFLMDFDQLDYEEPVDFESAIDFSHLEHARDVLGEV